MPKDVAGDQAARNWAGRLAALLEGPREVHRFPSHVVDIIKRKPQESD